MFKLSSIGTKKWTDEDIQRYVGSFKHSALAYTENEAIRSKAASGGVISAFLIHLLKHKHIDGALLVKSEIQDDNVVPTFFIATTEEEVLAARGSKYSAVHFYRDAWPQIENFTGKLAVVGLPCDITMLKRLIEKHDAKEKIAITIGLFCGHNSEACLTESIIKKMKGENTAPVESFCYRKGHWRGELELTLKDGTSETKPFNYFSTYQNLYFFAQPKCHSCNDHFGYDADISVGDTWLYSLKEHPIKHNSVIIRSDTALKLYQQACEHGALHSEETPITTIMDGQSRTMPFHHSVGSRSKVASLLGVNVKNEKEVPPEWHHTIVAFFVLLNEKISRSKSGKKIILSIPRPVLKLYLYCLKGLELLK